MGRQRRRRRHSLSPIWMETSMTTPKLTETQRKMLIWASETGTVWLADFGGYGRNAKTVASAFYRTCKSLSARGLMKQHRSQRKLVVFGRAFEDPGDLSAAYNITDAGR